MNDDCRSHGLHHLGVGTGLLEEYYKLDKTPASLVYIHTDIQFVDAKIAPLCEDRIGLHGTRIQSYGNMMKAPQNRDSDLKLLCWHCR